MTQGFVEVYGPYPVEDAATALQTDSSAGIDPSADSVLATPYGSDNSHVVYTVVKGA